MVRTIIQEQVGAYLSASLTTKSQILSSICHVTGMHRKAAVRAFAREVKRSSYRAPPKLGRPRKFTAETDAALAFVWEQYDYPCAERLHPHVPEAIRVFQRDGLWDYGTEATEQLQAMSLGAIRIRCVALAKKRGLMRGRSTTKSGSFLKNIPVFFGPWAAKGAGHGQVDTVVHSGPKLMGTMAYTVNYVDVATYWQEPVAQLDKTDAATLVSLQAIAQRLPWLLRGFTQTQALNSSTKPG